MKASRLCILTVVFVIPYVVSGRLHIRTSQSHDNESIDEWRARYFAAHPVTDVEQYVVILEDDIRQPGEELNEQQFRKGKWPPKFFKWPDNAEGWPEVSYKFGDENVIKNAVREGINHWQKHTCLRFKDLGDDSSLQPHIVFQETSSGCFSLVGRVPLWLLGQIIGLARGCQLSLGTIIHEIGHAIGFHHEQSRSDRDKHVIVNLNNMEILTVFNNLKVITENYGTPYDYYSIMHYGMLGFSNNGRSTMVTTDPMAQGIMGANDDGLSHMDKRTANLMYNCNEKWAKACKLPVNLCQNFGYLNVDCTCVCPPGTVGSHCEQLQQSYTDALKSTLLRNNQIIQKAGNISSPGYPTPPTGGMKYTLRVVAPPCQKVVLLFYDFNMWRRCINENTSGRCCVDGLEIRLDGERQESGEWYCGSEIRAGDIFESKKNVLVLYHTSFNYDSIYFQSSFKGFFARIEFRPDRSC